MSVTPACCSRMLPCYIAYMLTLHASLLRGAVRNLGKPVALCERYYDAGADEVRSDSIYHFIYYLFIYLLCSLHFPIVIRDNTCRRSYS